MIHAREDYNRFQDSQNIIPEDEPVFLLRGQDKFAPQLLRKWAELLEGDGGDLEMIKIVREHANKMDEWHKDVNVKTPDLPNLGNTLRTIGGYLVINFRRVDNPEKSNQPDLPNIYRGTIVELFKDPNNEKSGKFFGLEIGWNKNGECNNHTRSDCFIDTVEIEKYLKK